MEVRVRAPEGASDLAQGNEVFIFRYSFMTREPNLDAFSFTRWEGHQSQLSASWDEIFGTVSPLLLDEASEENIGKALAGFVMRRVKAKTEAAHPGLEVGGFEIVDEDFQTIKVQLRALGLIEHSRKARSVKDTLTYWKLTPYGDNVMTRLRAIPKAT